MKNWISVLFIVLLVSSGCRFRHKKQKPIITTAETDNLNSSDSAHGDIASDMSSLKQGGLETDSTPANQPGVQQTSKRKNLLLESTFEEQLPLAKWRTTQRCCNYSIVPSTDFAREGKQSLRVELRNTDGDIAGSKRSEIFLNSDSTVNLERWYGVSFYIPSGFIYDPCPEILYQWHHSSNTGSPPLALWIEKDDWYIVYRETVDGTENMVNIGTVKKDSWTDFVFHIKWSVKDDGITEVWKNGVKSYNRAGINNYNFSEGNYLKTGIYKWGWKRGYPTTSTERIFYIDEIRIGNEKATYDDVAP